MRKLTRREFIGSSALGVGVVGLRTGTYRVFAGAPRAQQGQRIVVAISFTEKGELREEILDPKVRLEMNRRRDLPQISSGVESRKLPQAAVTQNHFAPVRDVRAPKSHDHDEEHHPNHTPIVLLSDDDVVEWRCYPNQEEFEFMVSVIKDPLFRPVASAPDNPFGWELPQLGGKGRPVFGKLTKDLPARNKIKEQMAYKFSIWAKGRTLDPDIICGNF